MMAPGERGSAATPTSRYRRGDAVRSALGRLFGCC
jgi:hypothetical protein